MSSPSDPVLVLGATSRIGCMLRALWPSSLNVVWQSRKSRTGFVQCDLFAQQDQLADLMRECSAVLCLAGVTDASHKKTGAALTDNSRLAQAAIIAAHQARCDRVLLCSSAAVYGASQGMQRETATGRALSNYGSAKQEMEDTAKALAGATGVTVCCLRIGNLAGADAVLAGWKPGFKLDVFPDGLTPERSYIGPQTFANVLHEVIRAGNLPPVLNIAQRNPIRMGDLLDAAGLDWSAQPAPASAIPSVQLCTKLLEQTLQHPVPKASAAGLVREWRDTLRMIETAG